MATNTITFAGNLVEDPELRFTASGKAVVGFRVAVDGAGGKKTASKEAEAGFFSCEAWEDLALNLADSLRGGQRALVSGWLRHRRYEVDGQKRSATEVVVFDAGPSLVWATATVGPRIPRPKTPDSAPEPVAS